MRDLEFSVSNKKIKVNEDQDFYFCGGSERARRLLCLNKGVFYFIEFFL